MTATQTPIEQKKENVLAGAVGALLFSLVGGITCFLLSRVNFVASLSGLIGIVCACKGYQLFSGRESVKGVVIAAVFTLLSLVAGWYLSMAYDYYEALKSFAAEGGIIGQFSYAQCVKSVGSLLLDDAVLLKDYGIDLALTLVFGVIGAVGTVRNTLAAAKKKDAPPAENPPSDEPPADVL